MFAWPLPDPARAYCKITQLNTSDTSCWLLLPVLYQMMLYYIRSALILLRTIIWFILQWPRYLIQREEVVQNSENPLSWERLKYQAYTDLLAVRQTAKLGNKAPNCEMKTLEGESCNLLDIMKLGRPLVLNFGSCTWDVYVGELPEFKQIVGDFCDIADFVLVYIAEAHPVEGWRIKVSIFISTM